MEAFKGIQSGPGVNAKALWLAIRSGEAVK